MTNRLVVGVVLAGGRSSRFGGPKLQAHLDGKSLLAMTIEAVASVVSRVVVAGPELPNDIVDVPVPIELVADAVAFDGPLAALAGALSALQVDTGTRGGIENHAVAVVVGGDMPLVVPDVLRAMVDRLGADPSIDAVVLAQPARPSGPAAMPRAVLPAALRIEPSASAAGAALAAGDRSLARFLDRLATAELPAADWLALDPEGRTLLDVDRPADLDRMRRNVR